MPNKPPRPPVALVPAPEPEPPPARPPAGRAYPRNLSAPILATYPGYEDVAIVYVVSRPQLEISATSGYNGWAALIVDHFAVWPFATPAPRGDDVASWATCPVDFMRWICRVGYPAALDATIDPKLD